MNDRWRELAKTFRHARSAARASLDAAALDPKAVELVLRDLLVYRDKHVEFYGYEKQHYLIDSSLWDDAREVLRGR